MYEHKQQKNPVTEPGPQIMSITQEPYLETQKQHKNPS